MRQDEEVDRLLTGLRPFEPDPGREQKVRGRCHAVLAARRANRARRHMPGATDVAAAVALLVYLLSVFHEAGRSAGLW